MPRDGSGVYTAPPGTTATPNTTIESSKYNALVDDLVTDANAARPVTAGGTGETTARLADGTWRFKNTADPTKLLALDLSAIPTATTRTLAVPASGLFIGTDSQTLTEAEQGQARDNIGADVLAGFRNKIVNGNFDIWQRGTSFAGLSSRAYTADRWAMTPIALANGTVTRQVVGASITGDPIYYLRIVPSGGCSATQRIESVRTLAGKKVTLTAYCASDAAATVTMSARQCFGTGGSPSADVTTALGSESVVALPTWTKVQVVFDMPSISGKTLGSNGDDYVEVSWSAGGVRHLDITHVSLVEGDASAEDDPFAERHLQQELALCQRFYEKSYNQGVALGTVTFNGAVAMICDTTSSAAGSLSWKVPKRAAPTVVIYSPTTGTAGSVRNGGADRVTTLTNPSENGLYGLASVALYVAGSAAGFHYTVDAEL